jgi:hypothetical protein
MSGWSDWIFGNLPPMPARPASRGAMPGLQPYQQMPDPRASVTDERGQPADQAFWMKNFYDQSNRGNYTPSLSDVKPGSAQVTPWDPTQSVAPLAAGNNDPGPYNPSFQQNWRPRYSGQAPYKRFPMGPNLPARPTGTSVDPQMPYMGPHLPISPGDPGWTTPPSLSGPHNPGGDPARPGYDQPPMPMDFTSRFSPQQLMSALQNWQGWGQ